YCEVREAAKDTFSHKDNTPELVAIESVLHDLRQGDLYCKREGYLAQNQRRACVKPSARYEGKKADVNDALGIEKSIA
ncbi:unnamed protein product, partial [Dovyalis caffra]